MTELELRMKSALAAAKWLGTKEGSAEHKMILSIYNGISPLPRGYRITESDPWCAAFVSAAAAEAGLGGFYPLECSCSQMLRRAKDMGNWVENDAHVPRIGDWVLYNWDAKGVDDDTGAPDHVGIVVGIENGMIAVIEGNYDNAVKLRRIGVDDRRIRGYVCPNFAADGKEDSMIKYHTLEEIPDYARETVAKLVEDGSLRGISEDDLGLTEDLLRTLVILDRRGLL